MQKMSSGSFKNVIDKMLTNHTSNIYVQRIWLWITYKGWYAIKPNQTKETVIVSNNYS